MVIFLIPARGRGGRGGRSRVRLVSGLVRQRVERRVLFGQDLDCSSPQEVLRSIWLSLGVEGLIAALPESSGDDASHRRAQSRVRPVRDDHQTQ